MYTIHAVQLDTCKFSNVRLDVCVLNNYLLYVYDMHAKVHVHVHAHCIY